MGLSLALGGTLDPDPYEMVRLQSRRMKAIMVVMIAAALLGSTATFAQDGRGAGMRPGMGPSSGPGGSMGTMSGSSVRRNFVMRNSVDPEYASLSNPCHARPLNPPRTSLIAEQNQARRMK